jgi:hypothetical protein
MYQTDRDSDIATAEDRGRQAGIVDVARKLLSINLPIDQIMATTGLTYNEVENLRFTN